MLSSTRNAATASHYSKWRQKFGCASWRTALHSRRELTHATDSDAAQPASFSSFDQSIAAHGCVCTRFRHDVEVSTAVLRRHYSFGHSVMPNVVMLEFQR